MEALGESDDVRVPGGQTKHCRAAPSDDDRRVWTLDRSREPLHRLQPVMVAIERERLAREASLDDLECFVEPGDASVRRIERDSKDGIVGLEPAGTHPELDPTTRDLIERGELAGHLHGMPEVVGEHVAADAHRRRRARRSGQRSERPGTVHRRMITDGQHRVAETLQPACVVGPIAAVGGECRGTDAEPERLHRPTPPTGGEA